MNKLIFLIFAVVIAGSFASGANAQMMEGVSNSLVNWDEVVEHTLREEKEGKELWDKFQAKEVSCTDFTDEQYGVLGEYFMGQMTGDSHSSMNAMMMQMMGEDGEEQMHVVMGKRLSGCDTSAAFPSEGSGFMPMMQMMSGGNNSMMGNWSQGSFFSILWIVWLIAGILAIIWLGRQIIK